MKKDATPKCKGQKKKKSDEKEATPKYKELKKKTFDEKRGNPRMQGARNSSKLHKGDLKNRKTGTVSSPKPASLNQHLKVRVTLFGFILNVECYRQIA
jgi:hypothetical protein